MKNISKFLEIKKEMGLELPVVGVNFLKMKHNEHEEEMFIKNGDHWLISLLSKNLHHKILVM